MLKNIQLVKILINITHWTSTKIGVYCKNEKWGVHFEKGGVRFAFFVGVSDSSYDCHNIKV